MGLEEGWGRIVDVLEEIIPVYDRVNSFISLGQDTAFRIQGIKGKVVSGDRVLDAGSGFGNMSKTALDIVGDISLVMYDPLRVMLHHTSDMSGVTPDMVNGIFEHIPFQSDTFDAVLCGYSLRDAINLRPAIAELCRVTKKGGRLVIVDLGKPDNRVVRAGVSFYLRCVVPLLAFAAGGRLGLKFAALYDTYKRWPTVSRLEEILLDKYERVEIQRGMMGGAIMIAAYK